MKKVISISFVFIGLVIGAGFASGREIFQYFCVPSQTNLTGTVFASISFGAICYIIMHLSQKCKAEDFSDLIRAVSGKACVFVELFMFSFMFCGFFIMMSACGSLAQEVLGISSFWGILFLAAICFAVFSFDIKGLVAFNTVLVPLMVGGMIFLCLASMHLSAPVFSAFENAGHNPIISSLCYVSYNTVTAAAVLVPLSKSATKKQIFSASALGSSVLGLLIYIAWLCMNLQFDRLSPSEMPLLTLSADLGKISEAIYILVLLMALCTTAVSQGFGILSKFEFAKPARRIAASAVLCLIAMPFAGFGFSALVSNIYSAFGYIGFLWTGAVIWKYLK